MDKRLIFSSAHGNELWVPIIEKVWAKVHGTYYRTTSGSSYETFRDVLGAPAWVYNTNDGKIDAF